MSTTPINLPANRLEDPKSDDSRIADLERRVLELEDRLWQTRNIMPTLDGGDGNSDVYLNANGFNVINDTSTTVGSWRKNGDILFGTNVNNPPTGVTIVIFNQAQTYNGESMGLGDMLFGDNSSGKANMLWDASTGILYFRGGTSQKVYINTTGDLYAGGGKVRLNENGMEVRNNSSTNYIKLYNSGITGYAGAVGYINLDSSDPAGGYHGSAIIGMQHDANNQSNVYCYLNEVDIVIKKGGAWRYVIEANYDRVNFNSPIRLSSIPTSAAGLSTGDVWRNGNVLNIVP